MKDSEKEVFDFINSYYGTHAIGPEKIVTETGEVYKTYITAGQTEDEAVQGFKVIMTPHIQEGRMCVWRVCPTVYEENGSWRVRARFAVVE